MPDPRTIRVAREIARRDILFALARMPRTNRLFVGSSEGKVFEFDAAAQNGNPQEIVNHGRYVTAVALAGQTLVSGSYDGRLNWHDLDASRQIRNHEAHSRQVRMLAASPDETMIASVGDDMVCRVWNAATGDAIHELRGHEATTPTNFTSMLYCCAFSADGSRLATADRVGHIVVWDVRSGRQITTMEAPTLYTWDAVQRIRSIGGIRAVAFSPDGTQLAVGGVGQIGNVDGLEGPSRAEVFDIARRERIHFFTGPNGMFTKLIWHPSGEWLLALGGGGTGLVNFNNVAGRASVHMGNAPMFVHDAAFNEDLSALYLVGHQKAAVMELRDA